MRHATHLLTLMLLAPVLRPAAAEDLFTVTITPRTEVRNGQLVVLAEGTTNMPDGALVRGDLFYLADGRRPCDLFAPFRAQTRNGTFDLILDGRFSRELFPGTYQVQVTFDPALQTGIAPDSFRDLRRRVRHPLTWTADLPSGGPEKARAAEVATRETWRQAFQTLDDLARQLDEAFRERVKLPPAPGTWTPWLAAWRIRLDAVRAPTMTPGEYRILTYLNTDWLAQNYSTIWNARDERVKNLEEAAGYCDRVLGQANRNETDVDRVRGWLTFGIRQNEVFLALYPILKPSPVENREVLDALRRRLQSLKEWVRDLKAGTPGHAMADWKTWSPSWRAGMGAELNRLGGERKTVLQESLQDFAQRCLAMESAVERALANSQESPPLDAAIEDANRALENLAKQILPPP